MSTALTIGRFQPLHLGHQKALKYILSREQKILVGIGSSQAHHTRENPFTAQERTRMVEGALSDYAGRFQIVLVPDIGDEGRWVSHVAGIAPAFDVVYTNGTTEKRLFLEAGFTVKEIPFFSRDVYSATSIRRNIAAGKDWMSLVPESTLRVIGEVGGAERISKLFNP